MYIHNKHEKINFIIKAIEDGWSVKKSNYKNSYEFTYENNRENNITVRENNYRHVNRSVSEPITKHDYIKNVFLVQ